MKAFVIIFLTCVFLFLFISYRFGIFNSSSPLKKITQLVNVGPTQPILNITPIQENNTPLVNASVSVLDYIDSTKSGSKTIMRWKIDTSEPQDIYHTAIHFGPYSQPNPKLTSDYPEKSEIESGRIPATFSAQVKFVKPGVYYYRAMAIIHNQNIWSPEKTITVVEP